VYSTGWEIWKIFIHSFIMEPVNPYYLLLLLLFVLSGQSTYRI
jgi:hypothetical protein